MHKISLGISIEKNQDPSSCSLATMATPQKLPQSTPSKSPRTPGPCPYKGISLQVPGDIFQEPNKTYEAIIKGWNGKKTHEVVCKFNDGTQYWFPLEDTLEWMLNPTSSHAAAATVTQQPSSPRTPSRRRTTVDSNVSGDQKASVRRRRGNADATAAAAAPSPTVAAAAAVAEGEVVATADEVFDMPLLAEEGQQQSGQLLQRQLSAAELETLQLQSDSAYGIVAGVLLLLIVMVIAIAASRTATHDLEAWLDKLSGIITRKWW